MLILPKVSVANYGNKKIFTDLIILATMLKHQAIKIHPLFGRHRRPTKARSRQNSSPGNRVEKRLTLVSTLVPPTLLPPSPFAQSIIP